MKRVLLHKDRDFSLRQHHPWVLSGAIDRVEGGEPEPGETVAVVARGNPLPLALGAWSGASQIRVRVWTFDPAENIDAAFFHRRAQSALDARRRLDILRPGGAGRLVNAESDGLPGVTVDRYADFLAAQFTSAGAHRHKAEILDALRALVPCRGIYERSDSASLAHEGLAPCCGVAWGEEPPQHVEIREDGRRFLVDVRNGHKTGFYLDQRANRELVGRYAAGAEVLNAFAYTGGFGIAAALGGARHVTHVDLSADALELARRNVALNGLSESAHTFEEANVFECLRACRDRGASFDLVVLDPPKFADSRGAVMKASRGYKDIALLGIKLLRPGGILATFSCSSHVDAALFWKITAAAAMDSRRNVRVLHRLFAAPDHCVSPDFPQGEYLKGFLCSVV